MPTVYEDMIFGPRNYGLSPAEARVDRVLRELNLESLKHRYNHKISGGEKRMAAIATILTVERSSLLWTSPPQSHLTVHCFHCKTQKRTP